MTSLEGWSSTIELRPHNRRTSRLTPNVAADTGSVPSPKSGRDHQRVGAGVDPRDGRPGMGGPAVSVAAEIGVTVVLAPEPGQQGVMGHRPDRRLDGGGPLKHLAQRLRDSSIRGSVIRTKLIHAGHLPSLAATQAGVQRRRGPTL